MKTFEYTVKIQINAKDELTARTKLYNKIKRSESYVESFRVFEDGGADQ